MKMWLQYPSCLDVIEQSWVVPVSRCPVLILQRKLQGLKIALKSWNKYDFENIHAVVADKQKSLFSIQQQSD